MGPGERLARHRPVPDPTYEATHGPVVVTGRAQDGDVAALDDGLAHHAHAVAQTGRETLGEWRTRPPASNEAALNELLAYAARDVAPANSAALRGPGRCAQPVARPARPWAPAGYWVLRAAVPEPPRSWLMSWVVSISSEQSRSWLTCWTRVIAVCSPERLPRAASSRIQSR